MRSALFANDLELRLNTINEYTNLYDIKYKIYQRRGWKLLKELVNSLPLMNIDNQNLNTMIGLVVKLAGIYYCQVRLNDPYFQRKIQLRKSQKSLIFFRDVLVKVVTSGKHINYNVLIDIFELHSFWSYERFCVEISDIYFKVTGRNQHVIDEIFINIENNLENVDQILKIKSLVHVFFNLVVIKGFWPRSNKKLVTRYVSLFIKAVGMESYLCNLMELSIKRIYSVCSNEVLLFAIEHTLEHYTISEYSEQQLEKIERSVLIATNWYISKDLLWSVFKYDTLKNILTLIASTEEYKCSFGNEVFQTLIDTHSNKKIFTYPKIFYYKSNYDIVKTPYEQRDKEFMKDYRKEIHITLFIAFKNHNENMKILAHLYTTICLTIVEVLCDYTIAMIVCLLMNVQNYVLNDTKISAVGAHRIHAIIISIMSLICWLTNASMLTTYLIKILQQRAYNAPFLNPPLKDNYHYANHYVLWNKPDLFFETFEVRYGLWKRFRLNEAYTDFLSHDAFKKKMKRRRTELQNYDYLGLRDNKTIWNKN